MTTTFPTASVVSRALRRDVGIITVDTRKREGYSVHQGSKFSGPTIWVSVSDSDATNARRGHQLLEELAEVHGWDVELNSMNASIISVKSVPSKATAVCHRVDWERREKARNEQKTAEKARNELKVLADQATALGYQVTFSSRTETEGYAAGQTLTEITISTLTKGHIPSEQFDFDAMDKILAESTPTADGGLVL